MGLIIDPSEPNAEMARVCRLNKELADVLLSHKPKGLGYVLILFEAPMSLRRPMVSVSSDHDAETVFRLCRGIASKRNG